MGWFLETITEEKLNGQREVVKNERRQSYDNRPYGLAYETIMKAVYPPNHPYHWPVIGWLEDLDAATLEDVRRFFQTYYAPSNASLAIAGDVDTHQVIDAVEKYFAGIPSVPAPPRPSLPEFQPRQQRLQITDDVHLPRLYLSWHTPELFAPGDAEMDVVADVLGSGKAARLYRALVHEKEIAQDVEAYQNSGQLGSTLMISVTAREGVELARLEEETRRIITGLQNTLTQRELDRARNHILTAAIHSIQSVGGFGGKADRLNHYHFYTGDPDFLANDLARYDQLTVDAVQERLRRVISTPDVTLSVVPR
jgi:zinc protease